MKAQIILFSIFLSCVVYAQDYGGIALNTKDATVGYSLFTDNASTYLVDNCGLIVNKWNVTGPENHCKLLPDGNLLYMSYNTIIERSWKDVIVKAVTISDNSLQLAYEVVKLKNGNYLCVGRQSITLTQLQQYGYDINFTSPSQTDIVVEVNGTNGAVVWRWNLLDHVVQNKFPTKLSYGVLKDNPGKININAISTYDWTTTESFMINGMDYNEDLDQIILSVRKIGEVVIIDHSTTTEQAKTSSGGKYKKGGDLLYRYGNPANYDRGSTASRQLYFQHNPNWIKHGAHKGKIIIFNNLLSNQIYSTVQIIDPLLNADGSYVIEANKPFMPLTPKVEYGKTADKIQISSGYTSGAKVLTNGNIVVTEGRTGTIFEIDPSGEVLWKYVVPNVYYLFRSERYEYNYSAFSSKILNPNGTVEFPKSDYNCQLYSSTDNELEINEFIVQSDLNTLYVKMSGEFDVNIFNINGQLLHISKAKIGQMDWTHQLPPQLVFVQVCTKEKSFTKKVFINNIF